MPATREGWIAFTAVPVVYSVGLICFFIAVGAMGAVRASLFMNLEPIAAIILGFTLLGQVLTPLQLLGAGLVVSAIIAGRWSTAAKSRTD